MSPANAAKTRATNLDAHLAFHNFTRKQINMPNNMKQALTEIAQMIRAVNGDGGDILSETAVYIVANAGLNSERGSELERAALEKIVALVKPAVEGEGALPESDVLDAALEGLNYNKPSLSAAEAAINAHQLSLGIDGDDEIQVWHLLASLHEFCVARGVDFNKTLADVKEELALTEGR